MEHNLIDSMHEFKKVRMTEAERQAVFARVMNRVAHEPVSPLTRSWYVFAGATWSSRITVAIAIVVLLSAGSAFAAEGSLPGDMLYPVKRYVTEPLRVALAKSPVQKAAVSAELASRRLQEAETLAAQNRLTPDTAAQLGTQFTEQVGQVQASAQVLRNESNTSAATDVQDTLEAKLQTHAAALRHVEQDVSHESQRSSVQALQTVVAAAASSTEAQQSHPGESNDDTHEQKQIELVQPITPVVQQPTVKPTVPAAVRHGETDDSSHGEDRRSGESRDD